MKITTGLEKHEIIDNGTILTFKDEPLSFQVADDLTIIVEFKNDAEIKVERMEFFVVNSHVVTITFTNFNNPLGSGNTNPIPLALVNNHQVYVNFVVFALGGGNSKIIHYTWYSKEEVKNG